MAGCCSADRSAMALSYNNLEAARAIPFIVRQDEQMPYCTSLASDSQSEKLGAELIPFSTNGILYDPANQRFELVKIELRVLVCIHFLLLFQSKKGGESPRGDCTLRVAALSGIHLKLHFCCHQPAINTHQACEREADLHYNQSMRANLDSIRNPGTVGQQEQQPAEAACPHIEREQCSASQTKKCAGPLKCPQGNIRYRIHAALRTALPSTALISSDS